MYVWGSGIWGDYWQPKYFEPKKMLRKDDDDIRIKSVEIGGNFTVIQDNENDVYCWGSDYFKEVKVNPESLQTVKIPKKVLSASDKVMDIQVGGSYAICFSNFKHCTQIESKTELNKEDEK